MHAAYFALIASLTPAASALEGRWVPVPGNLWGQVLRSLGLPNYDVLISLNDLPNIDYVDISNTYTVPYIRSLDPPAAWETTSGMPYLALNIPTGTARGSPASPDKTSFATSWRGRAETYHSTPTLPDRSRTVKDSEAEETPRAEDPASDKSSEHTTRTNDEPSLNIPDPTSRKDGETAWTTDRATSNHEPTRSISDTGRAATEDAEPTKPSKPEGTSKSDPSPSGGFLSVLTQYARSREPACYLRSSQVTIDEPSPHIQTFCESSQKKELDFMNNIVWNTFESKSGGLHVFTISWVAGCLGTPEKVAKDDCIDTFENVNKRCEYHSSCYATLLIR